MANRIKQFYRAWRAQVTAEDLRWVRVWLNDREIALFMSMSVIDQQHCLLVACTARQMAVGCAVNEKLLMRSALLHDCGRQNGDMGIFGKAAAVLLDKLFGQHQLEWYLHYKSGFTRKMFRLMDVYYRHPEKSALLLTQSAADAEVVEIVRKHHEPSMDSDCIELKLLKQADACN